MRRVVHGQATLSRTCRVCRVHATSGNKPLETTVHSSTLHPVSPSQLTPCPDEIPTPTLRRLSESTTPRYMLDTASSRAKLSPVSGVSPTGHAISPPTQSRSVVPLTTGSGTRGESAQKPTAFARSEKRDVEVASLHGTDLRADHIPRYMQPTTVSRAKTRSLTGVCTFTRCSSCTVSLRCFCHVQARART